MYTRLHADENVFFCSKPCRMGVSLKRKAELKKQIEEEKKAKENNTNS